MKHIGFISTRFSGTDGVSLESSKWADVFERSGHQCCWFAGELDRRREHCFRVPEAHFGHPQIQGITKQVMGRIGRTPEVTGEIHTIRAYLKKKLYHFIRRFRVDLLVVENALTIPMNVPLGLAITEVIAESRIPTIAHHHDFFWERQRYQRTGVDDYLHAAFPPRLPGMAHAVINSAAQEDLAHRTGISATIVPNVLDFDTPPQFGKYAGVFRETNGFAEKDVIFLQPTRVVQRKGIEHAIELIGELNTGHHKLLISHEAGDEGFEYMAWLEEKANQKNVDLRFIDARVRAPWHGETGNPDALSLWDVYPNADFVTFPSLQEGFGNAFLEAVYFRKPILINRYDTFVRDIEPLGFNVVKMDGFLGRDTIAETKRILASPREIKRMTDHNYQVAASYFSYETLRRQLNILLANLFSGAFPELAWRPTRVLDFKTAPALLENPLAKTG